MNEADIAVTEFALNAAGKLIKDGRVDRACIPEIIKHLETSKLSASQKQRITNTLEKINTNLELCRIIDSICQDSPLEGAAARIVQATVSPGKQPTSADARKAVLMALLGDLRQKDVGSCFSTAFLIDMHRNHSEHIALMLKSLLENNCLTLGEGKSAIDIPLNHTISHEGAETSFLVYPDGKCIDNSEASKLALWGSPEKLAEFGIPVSPASDFKLHEIPGMDAALTALGISDKEGALDTLFKNQLSLRATPLTCRRIIEYLARNQPHTKDRADEYITAALDAFSGKTSVRLLHALDYTLASYTANARAFNVTNRMIDKVLHGKSIENRRDLPSFSTDMAACVGRLRHQSGFQSVDVEKLGEDFLNDMESVIRKRLIGEFDASIKHAGTSVDEVSSRGASIVAERIQRDDPTKREPLNRSNYQSFMRRVVEEAAQISDQRLGMKTANDAQQAAKTALSTISQSLLRHIARPDFLALAVQQVNLEDASTPLAEDLSQIVTKLPGLSFAPPLINWDKASILPWMHKWGGSNFELLSYHGAKKSVSGDISLGTDAREAMSFLGSAMTKLAPSLENASKNGERSGNITLGGTHVGRYFIDAFEGIWKRGEDPSTWFNNEIKKPADDYVKALRTEPPLFEYLQALGAKIGGNADDMYDDMDALHEQIMQKHDDLDSGYSLKVVHDELKKFYGQGRELTRAQNILSKEIPAKVLMDTNLDNGKGGDRSVAISYNPFKKTIDMFETDDSNTFRTPLPSSWLTGTWIVHEPINVPPATLETEMYKRPKQSGNGQE